jgi:hypothetical protein
VLPLLCDAGTNACTLANLKYILSGVSASSGSAGAGAATSTATAAGTAVVTAGMVAADSPRLAIVEALLADE